jgi:hypothetical protein
LKDVIFGRLWQQKAKIAAYRFHSRRTASHFKRREEVRPLNAGHNKDGEQSSTVCAPAKV